MEELKVELSEKLRHNFAALKKLLDGVGEFSAKMFAAGFTVTKHRTKPGSYDAIINEFQAGFEFQKDEQMLRDRFEKFLSILEELGGPAKDAAYKLRASLGEEHIKDDGCSEKDPGILSASLSLGNVISTTESSAKELSLFVAETSENSGDEDGYTGPRKVSLLIEKFEKTTVTPGSERSSKHQRKDNNGSQRVKIIVNIINSGDIKALEEQRIEPDPETTPSLRPLVPDICAELAKNPPANLKLSNDLSAHPIPMHEEVLHTGTPRASRLSNSARTHMEDHATDPHIVVSTHKISDPEKVDDSENKFSSRKRPQRTIIPLSSNNDVAQDIVSLNKKFDHLVKSLTNEIENHIRNNRLAAEEVAKHAETYLKVNFEKTGPDKIFTSIKSHCDFLDYGLIEYLIIKLPCSNKLHTELTEYIAEATRLCVTSPILKSPTLCHTKQQVLIKFNQRWRMIIMTNLDEVITRYFKEIDMVLTNSEFSNQTVCATLSISILDVQPFIKAMNECKNLLNSIGVLEIVTPDNKFTFRREDDDDFDSTLIEYVKADNTFVTQLLLQLGANPNNKSDKGITALKLAMDREHLEMMEILLTGGADGLSALILASRNGNKEGVKLLIKARVDINLQNKEGITCLIAATQYNREKVVKLLLGQININVNSADENGYTALHHACENGSIAIVKRLIKKKADVHLYTCDESTPLKLAVKHDNQNLINVLLSTGEIKESEKMDAISVARTPTMKRLLAHTCTQSQDEPNSSPKETTVDWKRREVLIVALSIEKSETIVSQLEDKHQTVIVQKSCPEAICKLMPYVLQKRTVTGLQIVHTKLTRECVTSFSLQLKYNSSLQWLTLAHDTIDDEGLAAFIEAIQDNKQLKTLSIYSNPSITCAKSLAILLERSQSLTYLSVWGNKISSKEILLLLESLKKNKHLMTLQLGDEHREISRSDSPIYKDVKERVFFTEV